MWRNHANLEAGLKEMFETSVFDVYKNWIARMMTYKSFSLNISFL